MPTSLSPRAARQQPGGGRLTPKAITAKGLGRFAALGRAGRSEPPIRGRLTPRSAAPPRGVFLPDGDRIRPAPARTTRDAGLARGAMPWSNSSTRIPSPSPPTTPVPAAHQGARLGGRASTARRSSRSIPRGCACWRARRCATSPSCCARRTSSRSRRSSTIPRPSDNDRGVALAMLKNAEVASGFVLPLCQDTGTATDRRQEGPAGLDRRQGRGVALAAASSRPTPRENLRYSQTLALSTVRREELRHQPAGADRPLRHRRRRVPVPLRRQGRRLGQQDLPVPGDQGAAQPGGAGEVPDREDDDARHRGLPALPPGLRHRRHLGRGDASRP